MYSKNTKQRNIGIVLPVSALRTKASTGVGEFPDLLPLADLCSKLGIGLIQLLPVNDSGFQSSPYSALTAFALNPLYLRISGIPEFSASGKKTAQYGKELDEIRERYEAKERFPYGEIVHEKLQLLKKIYTDTLDTILADAEEGGDLYAWIQTHPWVREYAVYRSLKEAEAGAHWKDWKHYSSIDTKTLHALWDDPERQKDQLFWVWIQQKLDVQFLQAAKHITSLGIILKGDLPILMNEDSCDVWAHPEYFDRKLAAGAPPDMFSPLGQNWQFPIYNWDRLAQEDYSWWRERLKAADAYYAAYRIDHVLGFFRIWAASRSDFSAVSGRFIPSLPIYREELFQLGFDEGRIRWLSQPHISTDALYAALERAGIQSEELDSEVSKACSRLLKRVGTEELWLFKKEVIGERFIDAQGLNEALSCFLQEAWRNRTLLEYTEGEFCSAWSYWDTQAFQSLSEEEKQKLEQLITHKKHESEKLWEDQGRILLKMLSDTTDMLACAEDLGSIPDCVPKVLSELGILSLRVIRWARRWGEESEPYIPFSEYPELSVCTPAVHDSSTVREWWEREADRELLKEFLSLPLSDESYTPLTARTLLGSIAKAASRLCVFQIQDLLHLSSRWYLPDPGSERINVPGTVTEFNWTYRIPATLEEIETDTEFIQAAQELCALRKAGKS